MKTNLYTNKKRWKWALAVIAMLIIGVSLWYTNHLVKSIAEQEVKQVKMWAAAMEQHAVMMKSTEEFFNKVSEQEQLRVELLANAYRRIMDISSNENTATYVDIIRNNISIPLVLTDGKGNIISSNNLPPDQQEKTVFDAEMKRAYSKFPPIKISPGYGIEQYLYYNESQIYTDLKTVLEDMTDHFMEEITLNSMGVPVIVTNEDQTQILSFGNLDSLMMRDTNYVKQQIAIMRDENDPLQIEFMNKGKATIFYRTTDLVQQMRYYPVIQFVVFALFLLIAYLLFSYARRSEQNQVWAGMAKETAHQLGTPLSSLMGWIELLKMQEEPFVGTHEMEKNYLIRDTMDYLQKRFSKKFEYEINLPEGELVMPLIPSLFRWVLENLTKNAIDAMGDHGKITLDLIDDGDHIHIDLSDTGKGIPKSKIKQVFNPGFTSKKRGWGLGLSLAKRIIEDYHKGKIIVKSSVVGEGTTFRITLKK